MLPSIRTMDVVDKVIRRVGCRRARLVQCVTPLQGSALAWLSSVHRHPCETLEIDRTTANVLTSGESNQARRAPCGCVVACEEERLSTTDEGHSTKEITIIDLSAYLQLRPTCACKRYSGTLSSLVSTDPSIHVLSSMRRWVVILRAGSYLYHPAQLVPSPGKICIVLASRIGTQRVSCAVGGHATLRSLDHSPATLRAYLPDDRFHQSPPVLRAAALFPSRHMPLPLCHLRCLPSRKQSSRLDLTSATCSSSSVVVPLFLAGA
ncbi:hypothetical protein BC628DRAFT_691301 [Trametes gibbosa]|nr:hypothetical protein BC628DRAFT_691301 [Trametes gibbosa]